MYREREAASVATLAPPQLVLRALLQIRASRQEQDGLNLPISSEAKDAFDEGDLLSDVAPC